MKWLLTTWRIINMWHKKGKVHCTEKNTMNRNLIWIASMYSSLWCIPMYPRERTWWQYVSFVFSTLIRPNWKIGIQHTILHNKCGLCIKHLVITQWIIAVRSNILALAINGSKTFCLLWFSYQTWKNLHYAWPLK